MGKPKTAEHRAKIAAAHMGMKHSPEAKQKMADAANRRWADPAERARLSEIMKGRVRVDAKDWTPLLSRSAVHNAVRRGLMPAASHCSADPSHEGPFHYDHCGDPPYSRENRLVVQPLCSACHVELSATRRNGTGYKNRTAIGERNCAFCGIAFTVENSKRLAQARVFCCREHYLRGR